jgi:hypothetical protein
MKQYTIKVNFDIGQEVFRKCDSEKKLYLVTAFLVDQKDVLYKVCGIEGSYYAYHFEICDYKQRMAILN